jgi:hypothetical protein
MARDAGLQRISALTRGLIAGVVALSGALAVIAANGFHGHTHQNAAVQTQTTQTQTNAPSSASSALQPASQPPVQVQTPAPPVVVSGGS